MAIKKSLSDWLEDKYGPSQNGDALELAVEELVRRSGVVSPPVRLVRVAKKLGINPKPVYEERRKEGGLRLIENEIRVVLSGDPDRLPRAGTSEFSRMRFSYAHELAHCFFYDLSVAPPDRLAPPGTESDEEIVCNRVAARILLPEFLLKKRLSGVERASPELLTDIAENYQASLSTVAIQVGRHLQKRMKTGEWWMLSRVSRGMGRRGQLKPRCIVCMSHPKYLSQENPDEKSW